ncbi:TPA: hypothetical protein ACX87D_002841 [Legionella pneumophila]
MSIKDQGLASSCKYQIEKPGCALFHEGFCGTSPRQVCKDKYHGSFKAMLATQKYYMSIPLYRQEYFQSLIGFTIAVI